MPLFLKGDAPSAGVFGRVLKLEGECATLKRKVVELREELRRLRNGETE